MASMPSIWRGKAASVPGRLAASLKHGIWMISLGMNCTRPGSRRFPARLVVLLLGVDVPQRALVKPVRLHAVDSRLGGEHGVVLVVVAVHAVAAHGKQVLDAIQPAAHMPNVLILAEVGG